MSSPGPWLPDEMENPHWCRCGWREGPPGLAWHECKGCGFTGIPEDSVAHVDNLLLAFDEQLGDVDWGPFYWNPSTREVISRMSDHDHSWALGCGDECWMQLIAPVLKAGLPGLL